jgi:hypothetical protein
MTQAPDLQQTIDELEGIAMERAETAMLNFRSNGTGDWFAEQALHWFALADRLRTLYHKDPS